MMSRSLTPSARPGHLTFHIDRQFLEIDVRAFGDGVMSISDDLLSVMMVEN